MLFFPVISTGTPSTNDRVISIRIHKTKKRLAFRPAVRNTIMYSQNYEQAGMPIGVVVVVVVWFKFLTRVINTFKNVEFRILS